MKYINADKLIEYFRDTVINETDDAIATIRDYLAMSSADVIEVVRCRDCKYGKKREKYDGILPWCDMFCVAHRGFMRGNDFCYYGERKTNDE